MNPDQNDVSTALALLRDSLSQEEQRIRGEGAAAMQGGDYDTATSVIEFAKRLLGFQKKVEGLVSECYFREHRAERDLIFHDTVAPHLAAYDPEVSDQNQREFLAQLVSTLNAPSSKIRQRLDRLCSASPDLLAVIKKEGKV